MDSKPLITCVIPTRDRPSLLRRALDSVLNQTYDRIEVIIVVSPPHKPVRRLLEEFEMENHCLKPIYISQPDAKAPANVSRNIGIREASGDYIAFLDDDDFWKQEKIQKQLPYLNSYSIVSCSITVVTEDETYDKEEPEAIVNEMDMDAAFYHYSSQFISSCLVFRKKELQAVGGFDEDLRWGELWDLSFKIMNRYDSCYKLDQHLVHIDRKHNQERMSDHEGNENLDQAFKVYRRHKDKVQSRTARKTWVQLKYKYYFQTQDITRYKYLFSGLRKDYELLLLRYVMENSMRKIWSRLKGRSQV